MLSIFAVKCTNFGNFWSCYWFVSSIFDKLTPPFRKNSECFFKSCWSPCHCKKNRLRSAKNVIISFLCILVDIPMGWGLNPQTPPAYALGPNPNSNRLFLLFHLLGRFPPFPTFPPFSNIPWAVVVDKNIDIFCLNSLAVTFAFFYLNFSPKSSKFVQKFCIFLKLLTLEGTALVAY